MSIFNYIIIPQVYSFKYKHCPPHHSPYPFPYRRRSYPSEDFLSPDSHKYVFKLGINL